MRVRMLVQPVGEQPNGQPWPETGTVVDLPDQQAKEFIAIRWAQPLAASASDEVINDAEAREIVQRDEPMPTGERQLIAWIGTDPGRAKQARAVELTRSKPRKGVMEWLDALEETNQS